MRILKTTQTYYPYLSKGGPPAKVRAIARALVRRGHEVTVLTADRGDGLAAEGGSGGGSARGWESREDGVEAIYLRTLQNYRATTINPAIPGFCRRRLRDYDVVHIYGLYDLFGSIAAWFCRRQGIPYVLEPLGMFGPKMRSQQKKRLYHKLVGDALFAGARAVIATSETERTELIDGGVSAEKIVLRRNGIDVSEFEKLPARGDLRDRLKLSDTTPLILFLGRISFIKGIDLLVEAFAGRDAHLVIAGPDDLDGCAQAIAKSVARLQIDNQVTVMGPLYGDERLQAFVDAEFFVLPSRYESFGNVAAEAIACGTPALVTDQCGIAPLLDGRAGLVVPADVEGLHRGIARLLGDKELLGTLRSRCAEVAQSLSWDEPVETMERLYTTLTGSTVIAGSMALPAGSAIGRSRQQEPDNGRANEVSTTSR